MTKYRTPGNWFRCPFLAYPAQDAAGVPIADVALADVRALLISGLVGVDVTAPIADVSSGVQAGAVDPITTAVSAADNRFYVDVYVPRATPYKLWRIRFWTVPPSPVITEEGEIGTFRLLSPLTATP